MKSFQNIFAGLVLILMANLAFAEGKIVVLDLQEAMLATDMAQERIAGLQEDSEYASLRARIESLEADMRDLQSEAENEGVTWSDEERQRHQRRMESLRSDYESAGNRLQREGQILVQQVAEQLNPRTRTILQELIEEENIDMVLNSQAVFHATPDYDITGRVTELLNESE